MQIVYLNFGRGHTGYAVKYNGIEIGRYKAKAEAEEQASKLAKKFGL